MLNKIERALTQLRAQKPLVLCLTNHVTMDFMANSLLAVGAAPIMSSDDRELQELVPISQTINVNIGTLDRDFIERCKLATQLAEQYHKPVVLDPVGAGASQIRTQSARHLMERANIIRGNASEILALVQQESQTLGVEATHSVNHAKNTALQLAKKLQCIVVISGEQDFITDGLKQESLSFGSPLMPLITGMGCTLTAVIAAFRAVITDPFEASLIATAYFGLCGNLSHHKTKRPGTFRSTFIDELYAADLQAMQQFCGEESHS